MSRLHLLLGANSKRRTRQLTCLFDDCVTALNGMVACAPHNIDEKCDNIYINSEILADVMAETRHRCLDMSEEPTRSP